MAVVASRIAKTGKVVTIAGASNPRPNEWNGCSLTHRQLVTMENSAHGMLQRLPQA